uniref:AdmU n=1 Tax=Enterobacter agglomerans TaxID=549 RepID=Q84FK2_ENTAG|nr:AdmU [Pantoea agglomerans]
MPMKKSLFSEEQIVFALRQAELGTFVPEICPELGISEATFFTYIKILRDCFSRLIVPRECIALPSGRA